MVWFQSNIPKYYLWFRCHVFMFSKHSHDIWVFDIPNYITDIIFMNIVILLLTLIYFSIVTTFTIIYQWLILEKEISLIFKQNQMWVSNHLLNLLVQKIQIIVTMSFPCLFPLCDQEVPQELKSLKEISHWITTSNQPKYVKQLMIIKGSYQVCGYLTVFP